MKRKPPEGLFARLLDSLTDIFTLVLDQDLRVIYANASFLKHIAQDWQQVAGRFCFELVTPASGAESGPAAFCPPGLGPFYPARTLLTREIAGKKFVYEATFYRLVDGGNGPCTVLTFRDVTERSQLESQMRQLHELERKLVQASMDGIIANDLKGNILIFNEGAARILGYRPEEVIGKINVSSLYPPGVAHGIKEKIYAPDYGGEGMLENYETVARHRDGTLVPIWLSARLLYEDGREVGIVGYFRDLRERKRLEEELLLHERLATLGRMVAHISHEIKNPLLLIGGFAQQLERVSDVPEEARRKLSLIQEAVARLEKFLGDLAAFTRTAPTQKVAGDLMAVIREVAELMDGAFKAAGVAFQLQAPPQVPPFPFDPGQIRQVLINLFKNGLEAMPQEGRLTVGVDVQEEDVLLTVADTGCGIPPEHMKDLFTPFFSTKEKGTGLGLTICRGLIEQHQGEIRIESEVNRGTTCVIRLPRSSA